MEKEKFIMVGDIKYVPEDISGKQDFNDSLGYKIVRTYSAGVFAGYVEEKTNDYVKLRSARRLWYWKGAASLSQLAMEGVSCPSECKFPCEVDTIELHGVIEILKATKKAKESIASVAIWSA